VQRVVVTALLTKRDHEAISIPVGRQLSKRDVRVGLMGGDDRKKEEEQTKVRATRHGHRGSCCCCSRAPVQRARISRDANPSPSGRMTCLAATNIVAYYGALLWSSELKLTQSSNPFGRGNIVMDDAFFAHDVADHWLTHSETAADAPADDDLPVPEPAAPEEAESVSTANASASDVQMDDASLRSFCELLRSQLMHQTIVSEANAVELQQARDQITQLVPHPSTRHLLTA
jgi:hypothetical protein